jgi:hypothetical protein
MLRDLNPFGMADARTSALVWEGASGRGRAGGTPAVPDKLGRTACGTGVCVDARSTITISFKSGVDRKATTK